MVFINSVDKMLKVRTYDSRI